MTRTPTFRPFPLWPVVLVVLVAPVTALLAETVQEPPAPGDSGPGDPAHLVSASPLGGGGDDEVMAVGIAPDYTIILAGNTDDLALPGVAGVLLGPAGVPPAVPASAPTAKGQRHAGAHGFIVRTSSDGRMALSESHFGYGMATIERMHLDEQGRVYISGTRGAGAVPATPTGQVGVAGSYIARLADDLRSVAWMLPVDQLRDFAVDGTGDVMALAGTSLIRYRAADGTQLWTATWSCHGDDHPGALALSLQTGVAAVVGFGMTKTGHEPYRDPYAYAFDRSGRQVWSAWNPDPTRECGAQFGGNGLMADTSGHAAGATADGKLLLVLYADGGNTVCTRDPSDPGKELDHAVFAGVHQPGPGYGFHGASKTSVILRVDARSGTIEKGTWMSAWLSPAHANGLSMDGACGGPQQSVLVVGNSASGCPLKNPWYPFVEGSSRGGGFLAIFDAAFTLRECGYFAHTRMTAVDCRGSCAVIGGSVRDEDGGASKDPVKLYHPVQARLGGGQDGYYAVFHLGP